MALSDATWLYLTTHGREEGAVILVAPVAFTVAVILCAFVLWGIFRFAYKQRFTARDKEIARLKEEASWRQVSSEMEMTRLKARLATAEEERKKAGNTSLPFFQVEKNGKG